ncbi:MAG: hypothetical protein IKM59_02605 [Oscillospiraceae bacterium]|nr:hypothetical protein [Oscillospiraceae bacterium]
MKILHLYPDMMNLYGDYANLLVLERALGELGVRAELCTLTMGEKKDISGFDLYYMGAGTERKQKLALAELRAYGETLKKAYEAGKHFLFTGNAFELMGKTLTDAAGRVYEGLGLFGFETVETDRRIVGDCLGSCSLFEEPVVGFMNKCSKTGGIANPLFTLKMGFGNEGKCGGEGICEKTFLGTHLTGPVLMKNPAMLREILTRLTGKSVGEVKLPHLQQAYETTARALQNRLETDK